MASISDTLDKFFSKMTEEKAAKLLAQKQQEKEAVDAARATQDWSALENLGYTIISGYEYVAHVEQDEAIHSFYQQRYDELVRDLSKTPAQFAAEINAGLDW